MSKYFKAEDVINKVAEYISSDYPTEERAREDVELLFADLPTIEVADLSDEAYEVGYTDGQMAERKRKIEVSEDCISREYLKSFAYINKGDFNSVETIREWIDNAPNVVPSRAEGEWIDKGDYAECSNCGAKSGTQFNGVEPVPLKTEFCPNCGAKMEGAEGEMTNLDYIRTLSAEELADLLYDYWLPRGQYTWSNSRKGLIKVLGEEHFEDEGAE